MNHKLRFQFREGSFTTREVWEAILPWFVAVYGKPDVQLNHQSIDIDAIGETLERARITDADLRQDGEFLANFGNRHSTGIDQVTLFRLPDELPNIESLIEPLPVEALIFGHLCDSEYERWQVVNQPERFEDAGRSHDHLPKYWDEDLKAERIDISNKLSGSRPASKHSKREVSSPNLSKTG